MQKKKRLADIMKYLVLIAVGLVMVYPLLWMIGATFKSNVEIFSGIGLIPKNPTLDGYKNAMNSYGGDINIWKAMLNTYSYVLPKVIFTLISSTLTAYGFGRFKFKGRG
ncbi:MAG: carbohydrate ABC transporter permease, partial [Lachnospiraceae bacterium]|nr:carbohydrate ABC transporter permease [Lachnospiraceae bacterium]